MKYTSRRELFEILQHHIRHFLIIGEFEVNQLTEVSGVIVIAGLYITGLAMIGIMLGSFTSAPQK